MNKNTVTLIIGLMVVFGGIYYINSRIEPPQGTPPVNPAPAASSTTGDGTSISDNLALGLDGNDKLGMYLIGYNGQTLYTYTNDTKNVSNCTMECAAAWPPYVVPVGTRLNLQAGIDGSVGTTTRQDGQLQVTYKSKPLYFYSGDKNSGDTLGQGVGGVWYIARP